eukprot:TRINITY_DN10452_c0_g3_i1.p3 TRINITY_DN10452_c0_g3~~TRINITY_DN10452_c0_g3_i1.p3  ORF type:complete len:113 (-),score=3.54 TRINITY_DN10452_c0_g3_i1:145-483(-)
MYTRYTSWIRPAIVESSSDTNRPPRRASAAVRAVSAAKTATEAAASTCARPTRPSLTAPASCTCAQSAVASHADDGKRQRPEPNAERLPPQAPHLTHQAEEHAVGKPSAGEA